MCKLISSFSVYLLAILFSITSVSAQEISLESSYYFSEDRILPSVKAHLPKSANEVQIELQDFVTSTYNIELMNADMGQYGKYLFAENLLFPELAKREIDLFVSIKDQVDGTGSVVDFVVKQYDDNYVNKWYNWDTYQDMRHIMLGFMHHSLPEYYESEISERQDALASLNEDAEEVQSQMKETRMMIDKRYDQIHALSKQLLNMRKEMMSLEVKMQTELNELEKDQDIFLELNN